MKKYCMIPLFLAVLTFVIYTCFYPHDAIRDVFTLKPITSKETVVIDAGHGGEDGGAISYSGAIESHINLAIALKLDQVFGLYGVSSILLRESDVSLHSSDAHTIRQKKVSDLQNRVALIQSTENPVVISIHQNTYSSPQFSGAQVFYTKNDGSFTLAEIIQNNFKYALNPNNQRKPAMINENVYLMNHIQCKGVLVECGFLSNPEEDLLLQTQEYQTKIAAVLASSYLQSLYINTEGDVPDAT